MGLLIPPEKWSLESKGGPSGPLPLDQAAMGTLSKCWKAIERPWPRPEERNALLKELMQLICLGPLLQTDLTAQFDETVSCSDGVGDRSGGSC